MTQPAPTKLLKARLQTAGIAVGALGATVGVALASPPIAEAAAAPNYSQVISDSSNAVDNFLDGQNQFNTAFNNFWNPIASQTGGLLPTFSSDFDKIDATDILNIGTLLRNLGQLTLPFGVPGVIPKITIPGTTTTLDIGAMLPGVVPGGDFLVDLGDGIDDVLGEPVPEPVRVLFGLPGDATVGSVVGSLVPPLSELVQGLIATQANFNSGYDWGLLGLNGNTHVLNTFLQTPSGLILDLTSVDALNEPVLGASSINDFLRAISVVPGFENLDPENFVIVGNDTLPSATAWLPQGDGIYNFPLGGKAGWWAAMPTAALDFPPSFPVLGGTETVLSVPITAAGFEAPLGLLSAGTIGANLLLPTNNGVYSPASLNMSNLQLPLGFSFTNLNITTDNYFGTNGFSVNNGQNILVFQNPLIPIPIIYSMGGVNFGPSGVGLTLPSLFGMSLTPTLQLGTAPGPQGNSGLIPTEVLATVIPNLSDISGIIPGITLPTTVTGILGLDPFIQDVMSAISPLYTGTVGAILTPISDLATDQYGPFVEGAASTLLKISEFYKNAGETVNGGLSELSGPELLSMAGGPDTEQLSIVDDEVSGAAISPATGNVKILDELAESTNLLGNKDLGKRASTIAAALKKEASMDKLQKRTDKLIGLNNANSSLNKRMGDVREIGQRLSKDPVDGVKAIGEKATERVEQAVKDIKKGAEKVKSAVSGDSDK